MWTVFVDIQKKILYTYPPENRFLSINLPNHPNEIPNKESDFVERIKSFLQALIDHDTYRNKHFPKEGEFSINPAIGR